DRLGEVQNPGIRRNVPACWAGRLPGSAILFPRPRRSEQPRVVDETGVPDRGDIRQSTDGDSSSRWSYFRTAKSAGRMAGLERKPADATRDREPNLAPPLRTRHCAHTR